MKIRNESTVRYVYGDPIVDMLIDSFGYKLEIEETVGSKEESQVNISSCSKTDYCCWRLYKEQGKAKFKSACITVLETKHEKTIRDKHYAQVLGYYCFNKAPLDHTGIAIILNEYANHVTVGFFIFPYVETTEENIKWGLQALLLPMHTCESADVIRNRTFLELIYLFCMDCDCDVPRLPCPEKIIFPERVDGVLTEHEYKEMLLQEKDQAIQERNQALQELQKRHQEKDQALRELQKRDQALEERDQALRERDQAIQELRTQLQLQSSTST